MLPPLRDVDTIEDARAVAAEAPRRRASPRALAEIAPEGRRVTALRAVTDGAAARRPALRAPAGHRRPHALGRRPAAAAAGCAAPTARVEPLPLERWLGAGRRRRRGAARARRRPGARHRLRPGPPPRRAAARRASRASASTSPRSRSRSPAAAARTRSSAPCSSTSPTPAAGGTALLLDGNIGIGGEPGRAAAAAPASCSRPAARCSSSSTRRAPRRGARACGSRRRAS